MPLNIGRLPNLPVSDNDVSSATGLATVLENKGGQWRIYLLKVLMVPRRKHSEVKTVTPWIAETETSIPSGNDLRISLVICHRLKDSSKVRKAHFFLVRDIPSLLDRGHGTVYREPWPTIVKRKKCTLDSLGLPVIELRGPLCGCQESAEKQQCCVCRPRELLG